MGRRLNQLSYQRPHNSTYTVFLFTEAQLHFAQESSFQKNYLEGSSVNLHFCMEKVERDISVVKIEIGTLEVLRSMLELETSIQDRVGLVGKKTMSLSWLDRLAN